MKKAILLVLCFALALSFIHANSAPVYPFSDIPLDLLENAHTIVRKEKYSLDIKSIRDYEFKHYYAVTILNEKSDAHTYFRYYDKKSKVIKLKAKIYDANGKLVREVKKKEMKDISAISSHSIYEDDRIKYIDIAYKQFPYTIIFECTESYKGTLTYQDWHIQDWNIAIQDAQLDVYLAQDVNIQYQVKNILLEPIVKKEAGKKVMTWKVENQKAIPNEYYRPSRQSVLPIVHISPERFQYDNFVGDMTSWEAYSHSMYELNKGRDVLSPAMQQTVKNLIEDATTTKEKIDRLYRYLQENMRYVSVQLGIGGWQTFDASYVEKNKYGDCKALSNFMKAMLTIAEIPSYQALVLAGDQKYEYDVEFVNPMFNHVILYIPEEKYWLECTSKSKPPNYLEGFTGDRQVLLIQEKGGRFIKTPALGLSGNQQITQVSVSLAENGSADLQTTLIGKGNQHNQLRYISSLSEKDAKSQLLKYNLLPIGDIDSFSVTADPKQASAQLTYQLTSPHYAAKAGKRLFLPINPIQTFKKSIPKDANRIHSITMEDHYSEEISYTIQIPTGYKIESQPKNQEPSESPFGRYDLQIKENGQEVIIYRQLQLKPFEVPAQQFEEVRDFFNQITKRDKKKLVLVKKT